jgi:hypothetical protein
MRQKIPDKPPDEVSGEKIECKLFPPVFDTSAAASFAIGGGLLVYNGSGHCTTDDTSCIIGKALSLGFGIPILVSAFVWGAASATGWANYNNCREYQERVSTSKQLGSGPAFVSPSPPNSSPQTP